MNPIKSFLGRLALFMRHAGGFATSKDSHRLARHVKTLSSKLEATGARLKTLAAENRHLREQLVRLDERLFALPSAGDMQDIRAELQRHRRQRDHAEAQMQAVLRGLYTDASDGAYPHRFTSRRFRSLSQGEEDGITLAIFKEIGSGSRRFVDIGCSDHGWNTGFLADELGWSGLMVDGNAESVAATRRRFSESTVKTLVAVVTAENINSLLREEGVDADLDLLSIDVDGNDYYLWEALEHCRPRLVIIEYNAVFGPDQAVVVPYDPLRQWEGPAREHRYFGASLAALHRLALRKGYRLIASEPEGTNAFFLRNDVAPEIPGFDAAALFRPQRKYRNLDLRRRETIYDIIARENLPLVRLP